VIPSPEANPTTTTTVPTRQAATRCSRRRIAPAIAGMNGSLSVSLFAHIEQGNTETHAAFPTASTARRIRKQDLSAPYRPPSYLRNTVVAMGNTAYTHLRRSAATICDYPFQGAEIDS
jgi:hypothetical protein